MHYALKQPSEAYNDEHNDESADDNAEEFADELADYIAVDFDDESAVWHSQSRGLLAVK